MKQKIFLSMLAIILAFAQVWAVSVDSLQIDPRTTSLTNNWNSLGLTECEVLVNGIEPFRNLNVIDGTGYISSSDTWSSIPSSKTFKTKIGKPATYTFTLSYCYLTNNLDLTPHDPPKAKLNDETGMFSIDETCTYVTEHFVKITDTDGFSHELTCVHNIRKVTVTYTPIETGTHSAKLKIQHNVCAYGTVFSERKTIELVGTAIDPSITVSPSSLTFSDATVGKTYTHMFIVTGSDLSTPMIVSWSNNPSGMFYIENTSATSESNKTTMIVTVAYKPTARGTHTGTITISGGGAENKTVSVKGTCTTSASPTINTDVTIFTFGTVVKGNTATKTFNVTGSNLTGSLTVSSNNSNFTVSPTTLPANGGTVTVTYKPTTEGSHSAGITISGGGATSKTVTATGMCVVPNITTTASSLAFGSVVKGKTVSKTFTVTGTNLTGNLTVSCNNSYYTVSPTTITAAQAAAGKTVTVTYKPTAAGTHNANVTISGGGASPKTVSVSGTCLDPKINISVSNLNFGTVVKGKTASKAFTVTCTNLTGNLTVSSNNSNFTVSPTTLPASGGTVTVTYKPTAAGSHTGTITISGGAGATSTTVRLTVTGLCVIPNITPSVSTLNFGTVVKNKTATKTFTVTGTNLTGSLTVSSNSTYFEVSPTTITAAEAAAGKTVTVTYKPTATGSHSGTITIKGGDAVNKTVSVSGKCVVPVITVNPTSLLFAGYLDTKTIKVTGTNLTGNLTVSISGSYFTASPATITVAEAKAGKNVLVQCVAPIHVQRATGTLTISGGGAAPVTVPLSYDAGGPVPYAPVVEPEGGIEDGNEELINGGIQSANGNLTSSVNELAMNSRIYAEGHSIIIDSPVGQEAIISDISGRAQRVNLQAGHNEIPVNASGVYIVRIREKSAKLMIK